MNTAKEIKNLENILRKLDTIKSDIIRAKTEKDILIKTLKKDFECSTVEQAEELLETMQDEIEELEEEIEEEIVLIEEKMKNI